MSYYLHQATSWSMVFFTALGFDLGDIVDQPQLNRETAPGPHHPRSGRKHRSWASCSKPSWHPTGSPRAQDVLHQSRMPHLRGHLGRVEERRLHEILVGHDLARSRCANLSLSVHLLLIPLAQPLLEALLMFATRTLRDPLLASIKTQPPCLFQPPCSPLPSHRLLWAAALLTAGPLQKTPRGMDASDSSMAKLRRTPPQLSCQQAGILKLSNTRNLYVHPNRADLLPIFVAYLYTIINYLYITVMESWIIID